MSLRQILLIASLATLAPVAAAHANSAVWRGDAYMVATSGTCRAWNPKGAHFVVRFLPANIESNGVDSQMAWFMPDSAWGYVLPGDSFSATPKTVTSAQIWAGTVAIPEHPCTVAFTSQSPREITTSTPFVQITGIMTNFQNEEGCTVKFRLALDRAIY